MSKLELILLGHFECLLPSGMRISLSMRKAEVLLAYLALSPGLRHPRERLINLLWSNRGEEQARNSLRQCLSTIKKSLGDVADMVLRVDRSSVSLIPELIDIDVHEFERLAAEGDYESLTTAADLYQGEFLEGISIRDAACQEWLDGERSRFKRQFIEILARLSETQLLSHDYGHAIKSAERLVKQDPLGETGWRLLMRAYFDSGDRSHALQAFQRCRQVLREELEVDPESATIVLRDQIAGGETKSGAASVPIVGKQSDESPGSTDHANTPQPFDNLPAMTNPLSLAGLPVARPGNIPSIAVLPFENISGDSEQEYFSDGITAGIILSLGMFKGLSVKSQKSSFAFKNSVQPSHDIGEALDVEYLVEGSIRRLNSKLRINAQLVEATSGNQVWGRQYNADAEDVLNLEQELSQTIAATISGRVGRRLQLSAIRKPARDLKSYDFYLRGLYHFGKFTPENLAISAEQFERCIKIDPDNAEAHMQLGMVHETYGYENWTEDRKKSSALSEYHLRKAVELAPDNASVHAFLSERLLYANDFEQADYHADKAIELNPNSAEAYAAKTQVTMLDRRYDQALECARLCVQLDPYSSDAAWAAGEAYMICGEYEKSVKTLRSIETPPNILRAQIAASLAGMDLVEQANREMQIFLDNARENMPNYPSSMVAWEQLWRDYLPFKFDEDCRIYIDLLLKAGLCDEPD